MLIIGMPQVIEYLNKKGYNKTEAMLRQEMSTVDAQGRAMIRRMEDRGGHRYFGAFSKDPRETKATAKCLSYHSPIVALD